MSSKLRNIVAAFFCLALVGGLASCGDTWEGVKKDTSDVTKATGEVIEDAGKDVQDAAN